MKLRPRKGEYTSSHITIKETRQSDPDVLFSHFRLFLYFTVVLSFQEQPHWVKLLEMVTEMIQFSCIYKGVFIFKTPDQLPIIT